MLTINLTNRKAFLIVEGNDEKLVCERLAIARGFSIEPHNAQGRDACQKVFEGLIAATGFSQLTTIGLMLDSEDDPVACTQKMADHHAFLKLKGFKGNWHTFQSPDAKSAGSLETLLLRTLSPENKLLQCARSFSNCVVESGEGKLFSTAKLDTAALLAFSSAELGHPVSGVANKNYNFDTEHDCFNELVKFLHYFAK